MNFFRRGIVIGLSCLAFGSSAFASALIAVPPAHAQAPATNNLPNICLDSIFYASLPGKTNYCLGLRDWKRGHYGAALEYLKLAAGWGNKNAQYTLGLIYYKGRHVPAKPALSIAWLKLANQRHNDPQIAKVTRSVINWASLAQRHRGDELYEQMLSKYGDKVAASRAWHHLRHWQRSNSGNQGCLHLHGAQLWVGRKLQGSGGTGADTVAQAISRASQMPGPIGGECPGITLQVQRRVVHTASAEYFRGYIGVVTVEPLEEVPAAAASSGN